jgi:hypothetical protein
MLLKATDHHRSSSTAFCAVEAGGTERPQRGSQRVRRRAIEQWLSVVVSNG